MPALSEFIAKVYQNHPNIKLVGGCYGHQLIAHSLGGLASKMTGDDGKDIGKSGRELIQPNDGFFKQDWV